jgi:hypothetical protein
MHLYKLILKLSRHALLAHTRYKIKTHKLTHHALITWLSYKYKLTRYALLAHTSYKYKLTRYTERATNRKKESLSLQLLSSYKPCNDKQQNDQKFSAIQPQRILRVVFLFIDQLLFTTESNHIDISHMSTPGTVFQGCLIINPPLPGMPGLRVTLLTTIVRS